MARDFNGSTDRLDVTIGSLSMPFTMAAWANFDSVSANNHIISIAAGSDATYFGLRGLDTANIGALSFDGSGGIQAISTTSTSAATWHHTVGVYVSTTERSVFLDGGGKKTETTLDTPTTPTEVAIGVSADSTPIYFMSGSVAHAAIWNVELTDAEIATLATGVSPLLVRPASLVGYWPLHGNSSPEIDVIGGNGLTLTGTSKVASPRIYMPSAQILQFPPVAAAGGSILPQMLQHNHFSGGSL